jgi:hypothetical protein
MKTIRLSPSLAAFAGAVLCGWSLLPTAAAQPAVTSAEPTAFKAVTAKLDAGGSLYAYLSTDQWLGGLSTKVGTIREFMLSLPDLKGEQRANAERGFKLAESLIAHCGVESVAGIGLSGIAVEKGLYRTRFVLHRKADAPRGYFCEWFGTKPHALGALEWLPTNTVWAMFGDLDQKAVWAAAEAEVHAAGFDPAVAGMAQISSRVEQTTGRSLADHLNSMGGELGVALVLDPNTKFKLPLPGGEQEFPEPALAIGFKVKDDQLFDWIDKALAENPQSTHGAAQGARWRTLAVPTPLPFQVRPTVARAGDYLWLTSSDALFEQMRKTKAGETPGLKSTPEFLRLAKGLPTQGNSFSFVSQGFTETLMAVQKAALDGIQQTAKQKPGAAFPVETFQRLMRLSEKPASFAVGWSDADGMQSVSQGTQEPSSVLVSSVVVAPTAVAAAMLLPALAQAKSKAMEINCMNNMKQIALGLLMYANDNDDVLPKDFLSIKEYIQTPRVLYCPQDRQQPDPKALTWQDFDQSKCSYEFLTPGLKSNDKSPATTVTVRCKTHGNEAFLDGHVVRGAEHR